MEIVLTRFKFNELSTIGRLTIDGVDRFYSNVYNSSFPIFTLEDTDRGLHQGMSDASIRETKIFGETAIPYGEYKVTLSMSSRFKRIMPEVLNVPGFKGIRIHNGSFIEHTQGCPLVGYDYHYLVDRKAWWLSRSRDCFKELMETFRIRFDRGEEITLIVTK